MKPLRLIVLCLPLIIHDTLKQSSESHFFQLAFVHHKLMSDKDSAEIRTIPCAQCLSNFFRSIHFVQSYQVNLGQVRLYYFRLGQDWTKRRWMKMNWMKSRSTLLYTTQMGNACPPAVMANIIYVELFVVFMILSGCSVPLRKSIFLVLGYSVRLDSSWLGIFSGATPSSVVSSRVKNCRPNPTLAKCYGTGGLI